VGLEVHLQAMWCRKEGMDQFDLAVHLT